MLNKSRLLRKRNMSSDHPASWTVPAGWAPLHEGEWELEQLRHFAIALLERDPGHSVVLDAFEDGYLKVDVALEGVKVGEVFVNRAGGAEGGAVFRLFVGHDGHEQEAGSVTEAVDCVIAAEGAWRDHPGTDG
jgi:hypothetical protein